MQALEGRPPRAISQPSPSSDENLLPRSRRKDGALVTVMASVFLYEMDEYFTERNWSDVSSST
jgi:hypothetical protein